MGVDRTVLEPGNGTDFPRKGDTVTIEYTGNLYDPNIQPFNQGKQFDSSIGRGDFKTQIGVGTVIRGWDEGVPKMSLGEKAILSITGDYAYGKRGFPDLIPEDAHLVFEVRLKAINGLMA